MNIKYLSILVLLFSLNKVQAQQNTEVYLLDIKTVNGKTEMIKPRNISNNEGYDNQPSFYNENTILFSSTRKGQTDIAKYDIKTNTLTYISDTPQGSEYSPLKIPGKNSTSAIRLDTTGLQRLYEYSIWDGSSTEILKDLKIGYHVWFDETTIVSAALGNEGLDLVVSNVKDSSHDTLYHNVGRSLHKIPGKNLISFISKNSDPWKVKSLNPKTGQIKTITTMFKNIDDICWLANGHIIAADNKTLMEIDPEKNKEWKRFLRLDKKGLNNISRIAVSPNGSHLSLVVEQSPEAIVQNQLDAYNDRNLKAFLNTYSEDIQIFNFPNEPNLVGKDALKERYKAFFESTPDLHCKIKNRIIIGNKIIDKEKVTANGKTFWAVAIYEVENGKIAKLTFLR
ncbi:nuclear transport factor 2 family protein [Zobellia uliginosa]|uniref:nuclear transport factor 2 family protein n=1 Tax=Zobellia uliginosa TaxID=143224 RepID=UPI0026E3DCA2|nr:nuclear transport factor 2 family protein [Zobellia uliginosa]MDO6517184.1 nuclear transport factor 2 family protein [Zobellia uliginosa]